MRTGKAEKGSEFPVCSGVRGDGVRINWVDGVRSDGVELSGDFCALFLDFDALGSPFVGFEFGCSSTILLPPAESLQNLLG